MGPNKSHKVLQQKKQTLQSNVFETTPPPPNQNHSGTICGIALNTFLHSGCISIHEFLWRSVDTPKVQICLTRTNSQRSKQTFVNYVICKTYFYIWCERYSHSAIFFYIIRYIAQSFCVCRNTAAIYLQFYNVIHV